MRQLRWLFGLVAAVLATALPLQAQGTGTITGQVVDQATRQPVAGAQVAVDGTRAGTLTDQQGRFSLAGVAAGTRTVRSSKIGYREATATVSVGAGATANVTLALASDVLGLEELVVVGYGQERRRNVAGAVASIRPSEAAVELPAPTVDNVLQGRVSGVQVMQNSGTPGAAISVRVRGASSVTAGNQPLYVIDGVPLVQGNLSTFNAQYGGQDVDALADLNPNEIESIEVLKDASAAAIYGSRASNGVVLITTKRGRAGQRPEITFNSYYGTQEAWNRPQFLNADQYIELSNEIEGAPVIGYTDDGVDNYWYEVERGVNTDWVDAVLRSAPIASLSGSIAGGSERVRYYVNGSHFDQTGIVIGTAYERLNGRVNLDYNASDRLALGTNVALTRSVTDRQRNDNTIYGAFANAIASAPVDRIRNEDGTWNLSTIAYDNPVALGTENQGQERSIHILGNAFANYDIVDGISARASVGLDHYNLRSALYDSPVVGVAVGSGGAGYSGDSYASKLLGEATVNFSRELGNGAFSGVVGTSYETNTVEQNWVQGQGFPSTYFRYLTSAAAINAGSSSQTEWNLLSYFGRASYNWNEQLTFTVNARADGSSRFGENNRFGFFPSASVLWRVSNTGLLANQELISDLALRASYGRTGNQQGIGNLASRGLVGSGYNYLDRPGLAPIQLNNPDLSWEKTNQLNLGADIAFFNDRLGFTFDWYNKETTDLLLDRPVPLSSGFAVLTSNIGAMRNTGFEIAARAQLVDGGPRGLSWNVDANLSHNDNEVTALYNDEPFAGGFASWVRVGEPIGVFYGYKTAGLIQQGDAICRTQAGETVAQRNARCAAAGTAFQSSRTAPGDFRFVDVNGDGVINADDRTVIGSPWADFVGGITNSLSFRGLDLSVFTQFSQGNEIFNANRIYTDWYAWGAYDNYSARALNRWTPTNTNTTEPRAVAGDPNQNNRISDRFMEDGSYVRLKNVVLGYNVPNAFANRLGFGNLRIYLQGQNLVTWTEYSGFDPEVNYAGEEDILRGTDFYTMPQARTITAGINIRL